MPENTNTVEARFVCFEKTENESGSHTVKLRAVTDDDGDDWSEFTDATPSGTMQMYIAPGYPAADKFQPGGTYRLTFERVDQ